LPYWPPAGDAVAFAAAAVASNPLEEGNHELLVRSLAMSGNRDAALREVAVADDILQRELGIAASAALRDAARNGSNSSMIAPLGGRRLLLASSKRVAPRSPPARSRPDCSVSAGRRPKQTAVWTRN
jgi:DNA-binding SARP family transcriptional activator